VEEAAGGVGGGMETMWAEPEAVRWVKRVVSLVLKLEAWGDVVSSALELESRCGVVEKARTLDLE